MTPDFEYFFWAVPKEEKPLYALYDLFDNHFVIQAYDYETLFDLRKIMESKTSLEIVEITGLTDNLIDNSVIENWGINQVATMLYADITLTKKRYNAKEYYNTYVIKNPELVETNFEFDDFKRDLQKQIFFFYYCLTVELPKPESRDSVLKFIRRAAELSLNYEQAVDMVLDISSIDPTDRKTREDMYAFLRMSELFYE